MNFWKILKYRMSQISCGGSRVDPCGWTDGHDEANCLFSQFCECAKNAANFVVVYI